MTDKVFETGWMVQVDDAIDLEGQVLVVSRLWRDGNAGVSGYDLVPEVGGPTVSLTTAELLLAYGDGRLNVLHERGEECEVMSRPFSSFSQESLAKAIMRYEYVQAIHPHCMGRRKDKKQALAAAKEVADRRKEPCKCWNSLKEWHDALYRGAIRKGDIRLLCLREHKRGNRNGPYMGSFDLAFDAVIRDRRSHPHMSWKDLYEDSMRTALKKEWMGDGKSEGRFVCPHLPHISTFHRYRKLCWTEVDQALAQGGVPYVRANHTNRGDGWQATRPMEAVQIDGTAIDFLVGVHPGGPEGSREMHRSGTPWQEVTGYLHARAYCMQAVDVFSGGRVGIYLGFEMESLSALSSLLTSTCLPERMPLRVCESLPAATVSDALFGIPEHVFFDGALANHGNALLDTCKKLGISASYAENRRGDQKPHVESGMRTLQARAFKRVPSRIVKPGEPRPVQERGKTMVPIDFDYLSYIVRWRVAHDLNLRPVGNRDLSPHEIFEEHRNA